MKHKNRLVKGLLLILLVVVLSACGREADVVSRNVSREADSFNVVRRVTVINMRSDELTFEVVGRLSIDKDSGDQLDIIVQTDEGVYKKHMVKMTEWNMYVVEDIGGADVSEYQYQIRYLPEMIVPFEVITDE